MKCSTVLLAVLASVLASPTDHHNAVLRHSRLARAAADGQNVKTVTVYHTKTVYADSSSPTTSAEQSQETGGEGDLVTGIIKSGSSSSLPNRRTGASTFTTTAFNKGFNVNGISLGFLPDDGSGGGSKHSLSQIEHSLGIDSGSQGWYAQCHAGRLFDGMQFLWRKDEILKNGGVFQPAVMPIGGWWGLTKSDNRQAVAICKVMRQFTDMGLEVWLRFAHEVNWYQRDGTYQGNVHDFKAGWAAVSAACKEYAPLVKMWYTPNIATLDEYTKFYPDDPNTVDLIGIDYYAKSTSEDFIARMKPFHDKYTNSKTKFAIGEIGLGQAAPMSERLKWFKMLLSSETKAQLPNYIAMSWFNYYKGWDFRIAAVGGDDVVKNFLATI